MYVDRLPPCNAQCPAGEDIQGWLALAESGDYEAAWRSLTRNNPLPAVMGRVCYHPCEKACNRAGLDSAVGINSVEHFLGDWAIRNNLQYRKPETASLIDVLGPWPWYILSLEAIALIMCLLLYLPFALSDRRRRPAGTVPSSTR